MKSTTMKKRAVPYRVSTARILWAAMSLSTKPARARVAAVVAAMAVEGADVIAEAGTAMAEVAAAVEAVAAEAVAAGVISTSLYLRLKIESFPSCAAKAWQFNPAR